MAIIKRSSSLSPVVKSPLEQVVESVKEYNELRTQAAFVKKRMDSLAGEIKNYAAEHGTKSVTGSYLCEAGGFVFGSQARKSVSFKEAETITFLKAKGLLNGIKTVETVDSAAVEKMMGEGTITAADIERLTTIKTTYAVDVKIKEDMSEVEQSNVTLAASRKGRKL